MAEAQKADGYLHVHPCHTGVWHRGKSAYNNNAQPFQTITCALDLEECSATGP
jgi:hypothetical protein